MKTKIFVVCTFIFLTTFSNLFARQYFDKNKDLLLANFDLKPDEDDVHSAAALGCMLQHSSLAGVNCFAVAGAYGTQSGAFIGTAVPGFYNNLFGAENVKWTNANSNWNGSVTKVTGIVKAILNGGGKVFVQEAGSSDFTYDVCQALISGGVSTATLKTKIIVVQHSNKNEEWATPSELTWVKNNTEYNKIDDGNGNNATPNYLNENSTWMNQAKASTNPNAKAKALWTEADQICDNFTASWENPHIKAGGVDFSDNVEAWWIFNDGANVTNIATFWSRYVTNNTGINVPVASVSISPASASVAVNGTIQLTATVLPANASNKSVTWTSNNANVTVSTSGLVTGKVKGSAVITVKTVDGNKTATRTITVTAATTTTNFITNPGFETGSLSPWGSWGTVTVTTSNSHSGTKAVYINGSGASEQTVTGLSPNTSYTLSGWGKVSASGQSVSLGVKEFGGSDMAVSITTTAYAQKSLTFTTGNTNTTAKIYFYVSNAAHKAYGDDFSLVKGTVSSVKSAIKAENTIPENSITENNIKVFPNPISGASCTIDFGNANGATSVDIFDLQGKNLLTQTTQNNNLTISNEIFKSSGIYLIKVSSSKGVEFKKVIVQ